MFQVNWPFVSGEEAKKRFSRWWPWRLSWISDRNNFDYFALQDTAMLPTKFQFSWPFDSGEEANKRAKVALFCSPDYQTSLSQLAFRFKKFNIDFQDGGHLGFPIRRILATFDLQVTSDASNDV